MSPTFYSPLVSKKLQSQTLIRKKLCKTLLREKGAQKMLVKLIPFHTKVFRPAVL